MHDGFMDAARITFSEVANVIKQHGQGKRIWLTGHSLGGAVAAITAMHIEKNLPQNVHGVYLYGAPPVGNSQWQSAYDKALPNTHRWSLQNDPVTALMVQVPGSPFRHVGQRHNLLQPKLARVNDKRELAYPPKRIPANFIADLNTTHLGYWCRLRTEASQRGEGGLPIPPGSECDLCSW